MHTRIENLQQGLVSENVDVALINYPSDLYYFSNTGTHGTLLVPRDGDPILFVRINYNRAQDDAWIEDIRQSHGQKSIRDALEEEFEFPVEDVGVAGDVMPTNEVSRLEATLQSGADIVDVSEDILSIRLQKDDGEIACIEEASEVSGACFDAVPDIVKPGMTEAEVISEIEAIKRRHGAEPEMTYRGWDQKNNPGHVVTGQNSGEVSGPWISMTGEGLYPGRPWGPSTREIQSGDVIVVDHGTSMNGYHSDEARTFVVGEGRSDVEEDVGILRECLRVAKEAIEPGAPVGVPFERARSVTVEHDREDAFMALGQYGIEYIGHGVGLEMDEDPLLSTYSNATFNEGMVVTVEPKFIYPDKWGAMLEDTVVVTEDGSRTITDTSLELHHC